MYFALTIGPLLSSLLFMLTAKRNRLLYNFFSLGAVQAISSLIQLIVIPYLISKIGVDGFGVVAVAQVVMVILSAFTDYGFNQTAIRDISLARDDNKALSTIFYRVLFSKLVLCFLAFILLLLLLFFIPSLQSHVLLYLMAFLFVVGQALLVNWFFHGIEKMQFAALLTLLSRVIFAVLVFGFIKRKSHANLFLFFLGIGSFVAGIISIYTAHRMLSIRYIKPSIRDIGNELKEGWHVMAANLATYLCQYANIFILRIFTNDLLVGYYSIAERLFFTARHVLVVFSQAIYPQICQVVQEGKESLILYLKRMYLPFFLCVFTGSLLMFIFSPQILSFFSGKEYHHSVFYLRMLSIAIVIICLNIPATLSLMAMMQKKKYFMIITLGLTVNICSNFLLVNFFEAKGTVMAVLITEIFIMTGLNLRLYRNLRSQNVLTPA